MITHTVILFLLINVGYVNSKYFSRMVLDFFEYKNVSFGCFLECKTHTGPINKNYFTLAKQLRVSLHVIDASSANKITKCVHQSVSTVGVFLDLQCNYSDEALTMASKNMWFDDNHAWLLIDSGYKPLWSNRNKMSFAENLNYPNYTINAVKVTFESRMLNLNLSINSDLTFAVNIGFQKYYFYDLFNFGKEQGGKLCLTPLGSWNKRFNVLGSSYKYERRWNFQNITLRAISVVLNKQPNFVPQMLYSEDFVPGITAMTKITSFVLQLLKEKHNFSLRYTISDRWIGDPHLNSTLAVTNSLYWKEQDISSTCVRIQSPWLMWMDYVSPPMTYLSTEFYYLIPEDGVGRYSNEFVRAFSQGVWYSIVAACLICTSVLFVAATIESKKNPLQFAVFSILATFCQQDFIDGENNQRNTSTTQGKKISLFVTGLSAMLLYNYYTSSVVSYLLNSPPPTIPSIEELIKSPLEVIFEDIGYTRSWLEVPGYYFRRNKKDQMSEDLLKRKKVYSTDRRLSLMQPVERGIDLVRSGGFAYHTEPYNAKLWIGRTVSQEDLCKLGSVQMMEKSDVYMVLQKNSPYKEFFKWSMMRIQERGHLSYSKRRLAESDVSCFSSLPRALALGGAAPAFILLAVFGWFSGLVILGLEILQYRWIKERNRQMKHA